MEKQCKKKKKKKKKITSATTIFHYNNNNENDDDNYKLFGKHTAKLPLNRPARSLIGPAGTLDFKHPCIDVHLTEIEGNELGYLSFGFLFLGKDTRS